MTREMKLFFVFSVLGIFLDLSSARAGLHYSNSEFGIEAEIPRNLSICPLSYGEHDHGFLVILPSSEKGCEDVGNSIYVSVYAEYNVNFLKEEGDLLAQACQFGYQKFEHNSIQFSDIYSCNAEADYLDIVRVRQSDSWPAAHSSPEDETPYINYIFELHTKNIPSEEDIGIFVGLIEKTKIKTPSNYNNK